METVTVYADSYRKMQDDNFDMMTELSFMKGSIKALAEMDDSTEFVMKRLKEIVKEFK